MGLLINAHVDTLGRLFSFSFDTNDIKFGIKRSKSGGSVMLSIGPIHLGYSNIQKVMGYFDKMLKEELNGEQGPTTDGTDASIDEGYNDGRILN